MKRDSVLLSTGKLCLIWLAFTGSDSHKLGAILQKVLRLIMCGPIAYLLVSFIIISYKLWKISSISIQHWPVKIFVVLCVSFSITNILRSEAYKNKIKLWKDRQSVNKMFVRPSSLSHSSLSPLFTISPKLNCLWHNKILYLPHCCCDVGNKNCFCNNFW